MAIHVVELQLFNVIALMSKYISKDFISDRSNANHLGYL